MKNETRGQPLTPVTPQQRFALDATAMLTYVIAAYVWGLTVHPLGRDYAHLAHPGQGMPVLVARLFAWEVAAFGASPVAYHLVNLALLYACMLCLYRFVGLTLKGPFWLGTLAAVLLMGNPVHIEAVLNLCGIADLLPCLLALAALTLYAETAVAPRLWKELLAPVAFACAVLPFQQNAFLIAALALFEFVHDLPGEERRRRLILPIIISVVQWFPYRSMFSWENLNPAGMFAPLYLIFYPLGLLPATARDFYFRPWLGWVAAAAVIMVLLLICRKARRRSIVLALLAMASVRLFQGGQHVDLVHMIGGGQLLLPNALFAVAVAALFHRMTDHPKWRKPIIMLTIPLGLLFIVFGAHAAFQWRNASFLVQQFQHSAALLRQELGVLPDYQYYRTAPLCLSESIAYDTPFSKATPARSLLPIDYPADSKVQVAVVDWTLGAGRVVIECDNARDLIGYPYGLLAPKGVLETPTLIIEPISIEDRVLALSLISKQGVLPAMLLPGAARKITSK